jgi:hypothetical protein
MTEQLYENGDEVVAHQKRGDFHRLVLCCRPLPQKVSPWTEREDIILFEGWFAQFCGNVDKV